MATLKTDYVDDVLDTSENTTRIYDIVDANGNVIESDIHFEEKTVYSQEGDSYGATEINEQNETINSMNQVIEDLDAEHIAFDDTTAQTGSNNVQGAIEYLKSSFSNALTSLKATDIAQFVGATGSTFASVISALTSVLQTKSVTATTSAQTVSPDSGKVLSSVTVNPQSHSGTRASVTANGTIDLGTTHNIRYVPVSVLNTLNTESKGSGNVPNNTVTVTGLTVGDLFIVGNCPSSSYAKSGCTKLFGVNTVSNFQCSCFRATATTATIYHPYNNNYYEVWRIYRS